MSEVEEIENCIVDYDEVDIYDSQSIDSPRRSDLEMINLNEIYNYHERVNFKIGSKVIDLRSAETYEENHLFGAINVPLIETLNLKESCRIKLKIKTLLTGFTSEVILYDEFDHIYYDNDSYFCVGQDSFYEHFHKKLDEEDILKEKPKKIKKKKLRHLSNHNKGYSSDHLDRNSIRKLPVTSKSLDDDSTGSKDTGSKDTGSKEIDEHCGEVGCESNHCTIVEYNNAVNLFIKTLQKIFNEKLTIKMSLRGYKHMVEKFWFLMSSEEFKLSFNTYFPSMIIDNFLYLGGIGCVNKDCLKSLGVKYVINCTEIKREGKGINILNLYLKDELGENISKHFDQCYEFIERARKKEKKITVHCMAGVSRSVTIVIAYLMRKNKWSLQSSYDHVKKSRSIANPNKGFLKQLAEYEKTIDVNEGSFEE